ncbi:transmembrane signal receptor [Lithospermum erythrorhizon]|uniref:non-specific serine/threonine protein kinase n=1 Tax=Lithospermum erythrorhizon TaxID=34254 RepID=A0AAV3NLB1_LITER
MSLFSMFESIFFVSSVLCGIFTEQVIILEFKEPSSDSDPFNLLSSWTERNDNNCTWIGVSCYYNCSVDELHISGNFLLSPHCSKSFEIPFHHFCIRRNLSGIDRNLVGNLPPVTWELSELSVLSLPCYNFTGEIVVGIRGLKNPKELVLEGNFSVCFVGKFPASLEKCRDLRTLSLAGNMTTDGIPGIVAGFKQLKQIQLSYNILVSPMAADFGKHFTNRKHLDLSVDFLEGALPLSLGNCTQLTTLLLSSYALNGRILHKFGRLKRLVLNISGNGLKGPVSGLVRHVKLPIRNILTHFAHTRTVHDILKHLLQYPPSAPAPFASVLVAQKCINGSHQCDDSLPYNDEFISIVAASMLLSVLLLLVVVFICQRLEGSKLIEQISEPSKEVTILNDIGVPLTYESVIRATADFSSTNRIGIGGFATVYRAEVCSGNVVAVKRFSPARQEGTFQFLTEVSILGRLSHRNIVTLIGFHASANEMFLLYNYLSGGNLEKYIQEREEVGFCWIKLHKISLDIASAVSFLHDHCTPQVLHRDIKPSNILLDDDCNACLSDFGLSKLLASSDADAQAEVVGTYAYIAPEYATTLQVSDKIDVYSYGVTLLELMSRKRALDPSFQSYQNGFNIVSWARLQTNIGNEMDIFSVVLWEGGPRCKLLEMLRLALMCTAESPTTRPRMVQVVEMLTALEPGTC